MVDGFEISENLLACTAANRSLLFIDVQIGTGTNLAVGKNWTSPGM